MKLSFFSDCESEQNSPGVARARRAVHFKKNSKEILRFQSDVFKIVTDARQGLVKHPSYFYFFIFFIFFICSEFCHTLEWNSHGFTCVPHPDPPSHLPLHPLPLRLRVPVPCFLCDSGDIRGIPLGREGALKIRPGCLLLIPPCHPASGQHHSSHTHSSCFPHIL